MMHGQKNIKFCVHIFKEQYWSEKFPPHEQRAVGGALLVKCMGLMALKGYLFNVRAAVTLNITVSSMLSS